MTGRIEVEDGFSVWYRVVGDGPGTPLLVLHGGPGAGYDYLESLAALGTDRPVVFYDQLGCGRSDRPDDPERWTIGRFCREIDMVRAALGLERVQLLGHSWGGWLAIEYLLGIPGGIERLVLASTSASLAQWQAETRRLRAALPPGTRRSLDDGEASGQFHTEAYLRASEVFYARHVCRLETWPDCLLRTVTNLDHSQVYEVMSGPNELTVTGNLRHWNRSARLSEIDVPTLVTCGRHDELTPACAAVLQAGIPGAELIVFEHSSHAAHLEEPERFLASVRAFLG